MRALILEDDSILCRELRQALEALDGVGWVDEAASEAAASAALAASPSPELVVLDLQLGARGGGAELVQRVRAAVPSARLVVITAAGSREATELLLQDVADEVVPRDVPAREIQARLARQVALARRDGADRTRSGIRVGDTGIQEMIGTSPAIQELRRMLGTAARSKAPVLLTGESGAGKELAAFTLHRLSPWARGPFLPFNPAAVSEGLLEAELFGHKKGAFTGAAETRPGVVETAAGGTLFLDEIGELPAPFQVKLLRFLDTGKYHRLGEDRPRKARARLVFATNRDLEAEVEEGRFRADLFHRLNVLRIRLPSLRERPDDLEPLAGFLLTRLAGTLGRTPPGLSPAALAALRSHTWPGNVRELRNVLERALILFPVRELDASHLDLGVGGLAPAAPGSVPASAGADGLLAYTPGDQLKETMAEAERRFLIGALAHHDGNVSATARAVGVSRRTLQDRITRLGLKR
jgi:DNA-binding NtrC family response regulator